MPSSDQGITAKRYRVIPRSLIFLFDANDRVLLLKGAETKRLWTGLFNGIGGHIEPGEDIMEAALRELQEETGIVGVDLCFCGQIMVDVSDDTGVAIFLFRGDYGGDDFVHSPEGQLVWISLDRLLEIPTVEDLPVLLPKIVNHQGSDPILIGKYQYGLDGELKISFH
mgnify:CR=1 FL=1